MKPKTASGRNMSEPPQTAHYPTPSPGVGVRVKQAPPPSSFQHWFMSMERGSSTGNMPPSQGVEPVEVLESIPGNA